MGADMFFSQDGSCSTRNFICKFFWHCYRILAGWVRLSRSIGLHLFVGGVLSFSTMGSSIVGISRRIWNSSIRTEICITIISKPIPIMVTLNIAF
ncbi:hypothetical protein CIPAW_15G069800 [Carya illinoinensis]|uniref:Uncharacterized protein n=1 Tax=Carya illinoinensis TaxID=32201 RepID=A0A8T1NCZ9_CARIL|nr:hypothetical protein CIPAW_15G069800 [Carya illinoinensis]KAG6626703.1 hypothetical protein CIPAW_15G069800 [Carya illinoinensis]KAG6626704.1 hypothetical protein CIPAW_15G069800 [Carya illinoinensis]KAG6626705.1 hypothetical protein CIPAW_15G069800 [Carya illinoinensis]